MKSNKLDIKLFIIDFDGVLTNNRVLVFQDGHEAVFCNRADGLGFDLLRKAGFPVLILSTERNRVVAARAKKLNVPCLHGIGDKKLAPQNYCRKRGVRLKDVLYVGNDVNDLAAMQSAAIAPARRMPIPRCAQYAIRSCAAGAVRGWRGSWQKSNFKFPTLETFKQAAANGKTEN